MNTSPRCEPMPTQSVVLDTRNARNEVRGQGTQWALGARRAPVGFMQSLAGRWPITALDRQLNHDYITVP